MIRQVIALSGFVMIAACGSSNPFDVEEEVVDGGDTDTETVTINNTAIPAVLAADLRAISYTPGDNTITVTGMTLDEVPEETVYTRNAALDVPGYQAYTAQDDSLDRHFTAYVAQSGNSGAVRAGALGDGGQFNTVFQGGYYERDGSFTPPSPQNGLVSYAGSYVGLLNGGGGGDLLPITDPPSTTELQPGQAGTIVGQIFFNVDFNDNQINGAIYDRVWQEGGVTVPSVALIPTEIAEDGTFFGTAEYSNDQSQPEWQYINGEPRTEIGSYGGIFGGPGAEAVGGVIHLDEWDGIEDGLGLETEIEHGVFVLDQCGTPDATAAVCAQVNPDAGIQ